MTDSLIVKRVVELSKEGEKTTLKFSKGWVTKFKRRNKIMKRTLYGEGFEATENMDEEEEKAFLEIVKTKVDFYGEDNVFNADETGVFYKQTPTKTLCTVVRKGLKKFKDRVSILLCTNMSGTEKIKPLIIGKFARPRCFKGFNVSKHADYFFN